MPCLVEEVKIMMYNLILYL